MRHRDVDKDLFHGEPTKWFPRYVGIEIECGTSGSRDGKRRMCDILDSWGAGCHGDASIELEHSVEIVTCPARGDAVVEQVTDICNGLARLNAEVDSSCGLHVHVDGRGLTPSQVLAVTRLYTRVEPALYEIVAPSRRKGRYSAAWGDALNITGAFDKGTAEERLERLEAAVYGSKATARAMKQRHEKHDSRYHGLNLNALAVHGTIEFRMHQGSVNSEKILSWAAVCSAIVEYGSKHTEKYIERLSGSPRQILEKVVGNEEIVAWMRERRAKFLKQECRRRGVVVPKAAEHAEALDEASETASVY